MIGDGLYDARTQAVLTRTPGSTASAMHPPWLPPVSKGEAGAFYAAVLKPGRPSLNTGSTKLVAFDKRPISEREWRDTDGAVATQRFSIAEDATCGTGQDRFSHTSGY